MALVIFRVFFTLSILFFKSLRFGTATIPYAKSAENSSKTELILSAASPLILGSSSVM
jgi:hypothetical protein